MIHAMLAMLIKQLSANRVDLIRGALLVILTVLIWCTIYNRLTVERWQTPIEYLSDPMKGDVINNFAQYKAALKGHISFLSWIDIPELGAPYTGNWNDVPMTEKALVCLVGLLARIMGLFAAANFTVMLGYVLAALSFYGTCRYLNYNWIWAFAGALVFAFSHFAFSHGLHHLGVLFYWHVPLDLLVCGWLFSEEGLRFREGRFVFACAVALLTGVQLVY